MVNIDNFREAIEGINATLDRHDGERPADLVQELPDIAAMVVEELLEDVRDDLAYQYRLSFTDVSYACSGTVHVYILDETGAGKIYSRYDVEEELNIVIRAIGASDIEDPQALEYCKQSCREQITELMDSKSVLYD